MRKLMTLVIIFIVCSCQTDKKNEVKNIKKTEFKKDSLKPIDCLIRINRGAGFTKEYIFISKPFTLEKNKINEKLFYGTKNKFPNYKLEAHITYKITGIKIILETSGMYNPFVNNKCPKIEFLDSKKGQIILGTFAQGEDTYYAVWLENGKSSKRINLSKNENIFDKYRK